MTADELDQLAINTIRTLSIDAVQQAKSGHPGTPMALAPLVYAIWNRVLRFDPMDPIWPDRDRFVLSNGHASMLLWSVLHLTGTQAVNGEYEHLGQPAVTLDDIRNFRQLGSKAPGHPEYRWVTGVEATTGPLGQGIATSVGMAIARKWLASRYNRPGFEIFNYDIYAVCGDSRQALPTFDRGKYAAAAGLAKGAYVMADTPGGPPQIIFIATGSEVGLIVDAHETLAAEGIRSRVVSMPSWDIFEQQPQAYRESVLPAAITARIVVEQGSVLGWERYAGASGTIIGMKTFGASAPLRELQRKFGFEPERVVAAARALLGRS